MGQTIGPREQALRALRESNQERNRRMEPKMKKQIATKALAATAKIKPAKASKAKKRAKAAAKAKTAAKPAADPEPGRKNKTEQLREFLQTPGGVICKQIEHKFGWLPHSARAALSKIPDKKTTKDEARGGTVYSLPAKAKAA